jgi:DNA-binding NtrC family response regulator
MKVVTMENRIQIINFRRSNEQNRTMSRKVTDDFVDLPGFTIKSPCMLKVLEEVNKYAENGYPVLLLGPSGSGKEFVARDYFKVYKNSFRFEECKFHTINCSHLKEELAMSELFGHVKGAFTGAVDDKTGFFQEIDYGVLFCDEIGDLDEKVQPMFLRALNINNKLREGRKLGSTQSFQINPNLSVVCATEKPETSIRESLLYRLGAVLHVPGMKDRPEDVESALPWLFNESISHIRASFNFLKQLTGTTDTVYHKLFWKNMSENVSGSLLKMVTERVWPGNFRALTAAVFQTVIRSSDSKTATQLEENIIRNFREIASGFSFKPEKNISIPFQNEKIGSEKREAFEKWNSKLALIFPKISPAEMAKMAEFLFDFAGKAIRRSDFETFIGLYNTPRTAQFRMKKLVENGIVNEKERGIYSVNRMLANETFPVFANSSEVKIPGITNLINEKNFGKLIDLIEDSRGTYISIPTPDLETRIGELLFMELNSKNKVYYFPVKEKKFEEVIEIFKDEISLHKTGIHFENALSKLMTPDLQIAFMSGYLEPVLCSDKKPVMIISGVSDIPTKEQRELLLKIIGCWSFFLFVLVGRKKENEFTELTEFVIDNIE